MCALWKGIRKQCAGNSGYRRCAIFGRSGYKHNQGVAVSCSSNKKVLVASPLCRGGILVRRSFLWCLVPECNGEVHRFCTEELLAELGGLFWGIFLAAEDIQVCRIGLIGKVS